MCFKNTKHTKYDERKIASSFFKIVSRWDSPVSIFTDKAVTTQTFFSCCWYLDTCINTDKEKKMAAMLSITTSQPWGAFLKSVVVSS